MTLERMRTNYNKKVIKKDNACWGWLGSPMRGYGTISYGTGNIILSHRASWILHRGEIPKGLSVCHTCDNKTCTNPEHLFLGNQKDNMLDFRRKLKNGLIKNNSPIHQYVLHMPCDMHKTIKHLCIEKNITMNNFILEALQQKIREYREYQ